MRGGEFAARVRGRAARSVTHIRGLRGVIGGTVAMWRLWRKILWRLGIGHRAAFVIGFGSVYVLMGAGVILSPAPPDPLLFHTDLPAWFRFGLWSVCGLAALVVANHARYQWIAFIVLTPPPIERGASYLFAVVETMPFGPPIPWPYLTGVGIYALMLFLVGNASDWPDPVADPPLLGEAGESREAGTR